MGGFGPADPTGPAASPAPGADRWWNVDDGRQAGQDQQATGTGDEFPRIIRTRLRG
jgi:hypothetical protein